MTVVSSTYIDYILEGSLSLFNGIWSIILPLLCNIGLLGSSHECGSAIQNIKILWVSFQFFSKIFSPPSLHCLRLKFNFTLKSPSHLMQQLWIYWLWLTSKSPLNGIYPWGSQAGEVAILSDQRNRWSLDFETNEGKASFRVTRFHTIPYRNYTHHSSLSTPLI